MHGRTELVGTQQLDGFLGDVLGIENLFESHELLGELQPPHMGVHLEEVHLLLLLIPIAP